MADVTLDDIEWTGRINGQPVVDDYAGRPFVATEWRANQTCVGRRFVTIMGPSVRVDGTVGKQRRFLSYQVGRDPLGEIAAAVADILGWDR